MRDNTVSMVRAVVDRTTEKKGVTIRLWPPTMLGCYVGILLLDSQVRIWTGEGPGHWIHKFLDLVS